MNAEFLTTEYETANTVLQLLGKLQGELKASLNPHRMALKELGMDRMGWVPKPYNDKAFSLWNKLYSDNPDDHQTLHHLVIMHHARAMDAEIGGNPSDADADWEKAISYWHKLSKNDSFWDYLATIACKDAKRDSVDELRVRFPELLLQVHYDIAFDDATLHHRAKYHLRMAWNSPFSDEVKQSVQQNVYNRFISILPQEIWSPSMREPEMILEGTSVIEKFLERDPTCIPALTDVLRLQVKLLFSRYQDIQAEGDGDENSRQNLLRELREESAKWQEYFDQLVDQSEQLDDDIRQKLCMWYRVMGELDRALDKDERAIKLYEQGVKAGIQHDMDYRLCVSRLGETDAYVALGRAHKGDSGARTHCDAVCNNRKLSVAAYRLLANAYLLLDEYDIAEQLCIDGQECSLGTSDFDELQVHEEGRIHLQEYLETIKVERKKHQAWEFIKRAIDLKDKEQYYDALTSINEAITVDPDIPEAYYISSQCNYESGNLESAMSDIETYLQLNLKTGDSDYDEAIKHAQPLQEAIKSKQQDIAIFGKKGIELRSKAAQAHNSNNFSAAEAYLREAIRQCPSVRKNKLGKAIQHSLSTNSEPLQCPSAGKDKLGEELALVLSGGAVNSVNQVMENDSTTLSHKISVCEREMKNLVEAKHLSKQKSDINHQISNLQELLTNLNQAHEGEQRVISDFGNQKAFELQQKAVQHYNASRLDKAINLYRQALSASGGKKQIKEELSGALCQAAIQKVNACTSNPSRSVLSDAKDMLQEAVDLDFSNEHARENLKAVRGIITQLSC